MRGHTLPLDRNLKKVAVIGPLADAASDIEGGWTVEGLFGGAGKSHPVTVLAGIRNKLGPDAQVTLVAGPRPGRKYPSSISDAPGPKAGCRAHARRDRRVPGEEQSGGDGSGCGGGGSGRDADMNGEAASRARLEMPGIQEQMLETVVATGKPVVLVLENGRPLDIQWAAAHVPAILEVWYPGTEGGNGVADVLFGDVNPGGKLPVSWPRSSGQEPLYYNHNLTHDPEDSRDSHRVIWTSPANLSFPSATA